MKKCCESLFVKITILYQVIFLGFYTAVVVIDICAQIGLLLYPNMKKLSNYRIIKIISMIIEKGKEVDIIITEAELFSIFDDNIRKNILEQGAFVQGADYYSM